MVHCETCGHEWDMTEAEGIACPNCGETQNVVDIEENYEYDNESMGRGAFNWNKK